MKQFLVVREHKYQHLHQSIFLEMQVEHKKARQWICPLLECQYNITINFNFYVINVKLSLK